ncbi:MAG: helix-turn-helix domain-containing protein [Clostridia bacterium]|nr:helix-turn-helix domain-containing protein [Clostridia bacterium]
MQNTRERIQQEALKLFARNGYEAVSVRDIAGRLGIAQSALYKHYANKRAIFESIVSRMQAEDLSRAQAFAVPEARLADDAAAYRGMRVETIQRYTFAQFLYWVEDDFAADFRRMLTLEQYRSDEMMALYQQYLSGGVIDYVEDLFREMGRFYDWRGREPRQLALLFYAPVYMLMNLYDGTADKAGTVALASAHIDGFFAGLQQA